MSVDLQAFFRVSRCERISSVQLMTQHFWQGKVVCPDRNVECWAAHSFWFTWHRDTTHFITNIQLQLQQIEKLNIWRWSQSYRYYRNKINSIQKKISNQQFLSISIFESIRRVPWIDGVFITHTWLDSSYVKNQNLQWFSPAPSSTLITFFLRRMAFSFRRSYFRSCF